MVTTDHWQHLRMRPTPQAVSGLGSGHLYEGSFDSCTGAIAATGTTIGATSKTYPLTKASAHDLPDSLQPAPTAPAGDPLDAASAGAARPIATTGTAHGTPLRSRVDERWASGLGIAPAEVLVSRVFRPRSCSTMLTRRGPWCRGGANQVRTNQQPTFAGPTTSGRGWLGRRSLAPPAVRHGRRPNQTHRPDGGWALVTSVAAPHTTHSGRRPLCGRDARTSPHPVCHAPPSARPLPHTQPVGNSLPLERTSPDYVTCFTQPAHQRDGCGPRNGRSQSVGEGAAKCVYRSTSTEA